MENKLAVLLGGRAAETVIYEDISTGASDDLTKATDIARNMVTRYGMTKALGPVTYETDPPPFLTGPLGSASDNHRMSEETTHLIDAAVRDLINKALDRAVRILTDYQDVLENGAHLLLERETLTQER